MQRALIDENDPLRTALLQAGRPLPQLVATAFATAVRHLRRIAGRAPERWRWGRIQRIRLGIVLGEIPLIGRGFRALDVPFPGDHYTVSPSIPLPTATKRLRAFAGATSRFICDLARPEEALFAHSSGPSGDVGSSYFASLSRDWSHFRYFRSALWAPEEVPDVVERLVIEPPPP